MYICLVVGFNVSLCVCILQLIRKLSWQTLVWFKMTRKQKSPTSIRKLIFYKVHLDMRLVWFLIANTKFKIHLDKRLVWFINTNTKFKIHLDTRLVWLPERARLNLERLDLLLAHWFAVFVLFWWPSNIFHLPHWFAVSILCWWSSDFLSALCYISQLSGYDHEVGQLTN